LRPTKSPRPYFPLCLEDAGVKVCPNCGTEYRELVGQ
jgi:uncharacterized Zn-finger protein